MTEFQKMPRFRKALIVSGLAFTALLIATLIGYFRGLWDDDGSMTQGIEWAIKTDAVFLLLIAISFLFGRIQTFLESRYHLPHILGTAVGMGFIFMIISGVSILLGIDSRDFWIAVRDDFIIGTLSGGLGMLLVQLTYKEKVSN